MSPDQESPGQEPRPGRGQGYRILGEAVLWIVGIAVILGVGRLLQAAAPGLLVALKFAVLNPIALIFWGGVVFWFRRRARRRRIIQVRTPNDDPGR